MDMFFLRDILAPPPPLTHSPPADEPQQQQQPMVMVVQAQSVELNTEADAKPTAADLLAAEPVAIGVEAAPQQPQLIGDEADSKPTQPQQSDVHAPLSQPNLTPLSPSSDTHPPASTPSTAPASRTNRRSSRDRTAHDSSPADLQAAAATPSAHLDPLVPVPPVAASLALLELDLASPSVVSLSLLFPVSCSMGETPSVTTPFTRATLSQLGCISPRSKHALYSTLSPVFGEDEQDSMADQSIDECNGADLSALQRSPSHPAHSPLPPLTPFSLLVCQQIGAQQQQYLQWRSQHAPLTPRSEQQLLQDALGNLDGSMDDDDDARHYTPPGGSSSSAATTPASAMRQRWQRQESPENSPPARLQQVWETNGSGTDELPAAAPASIATLPPKHFSFDVTQCQPDVAETAGALLRTLEERQTAPAPTAASLVAPLDAPSCTSLQPLRLVITFLPLLLLACVLLILGMDAASSSSSSSQPQALAFVTGLLSSALDAIAPPVWLFSPLDWLDEASTYCI